ncbi:hypothetical protein EON67_07045 [archaeon]|nr:MAG: hypothetical protein EON67_07045 [archaeon]
MQMVENPSRCTAICVRISRLFMFLIFGLPALALALLSFVVCPCVCLPACFNRDTTPGAYFSNLLTIWMAILTSVVFGSIAVAIALPFAILLCLLNCFLIAPVRAISRACR